jgi:hypothetical protein
MTKSYYRKEGAAVAPKLYNPAWVIEYPSTFEKVTYYHDTMIRSQNNHAM